MSMDSMVSDAEIGLRALLIPQSLLAMGMTPSSVAEVRAAHNEKMTRMDPWRAKVQEHMDRCHMRIYRRLMRWHLGHHLPKRLRASRSMR